jgi:hypothetical protein
MNRNTLLLLLFLIVISCLSFLIFNEFRSPKQKNQEVSVTPVIKSNPFEKNTLTIQNTPDSVPIDIVTDCFSWYVNSFIDGADYVDALEDPKLRECFTPTYVENFERIATDEGADPVLLVQNDSESWKQRPEVRLIATSQDITATEVALGSGTEIIRYKVTLQKIDTKWLISNVSVLSQ